MFCEKGVLKKKVFFIKKETLAQVFSSEFREIFKNTFLYRTLPVTASGVYSGRIFLVSGGEER